MIYSTRLPAIAATLCLVVAGISPLLAAEEKVASFEAGEQGTAQWRDLSFWIHADGKKEISYSHGSDRTAIEVQSKGVTGSGDAARLHLAFPAGRSMDVAIAGKALRVDEGKGQPAATFGWEYEGPVDGRGTFCTPCVEEADAIPFVRKHFIR